MPQANSTTSRPLVTSPAASESTLPCSAVITRGQLVRLGAQQLAEREHHRGPLRTSDVPRQPGSGRGAAPPRRRRRPAGEVDLPADLAGGRVEDVAACRPVPSHGLPSIQCVTCFMPCALPGRPGLAAAFWSLTACRTSTGCPALRLASVLGQRQRRGHPQRVAVQAALADEQPAAPGLLEHRGGRAGLGAPVAGSTSSTASIRPLPRTSPTIRHARRRPPAARR